MKKERIHVTSEIRARIKEEMKKNGLKNETVAEYLRIEPGTYSRIINDKIAMTSEHLQGLLKLFGVRENYLLCIDNYRTESDIYETKENQLTEEHRAMIRLLETFGYSFETVELLEITARDLAGFKDMDKELDFIADHVIGCSPSDLINVLNNETINSPVHNVFEMSGGLIEKYLYPHDRTNRKAKVLTFKKGSFKVYPDEEGCYYESVFYISFHVKITKNGELLGYVKDLSDYMNVLNNSTKTLFSSLLEMDKNKYTDYRKIY